MSQDVIKSIGNDHETLAREARDAWRTFEAADRSSSLDSFPEADDELFSFTDNPYSI